MKDFEAETTKQDAKWKKMMEAAEYWATMREDPYVDEFYVEQARRDEAFSNRSKEWAEGKKKEAEGVERGAAEGQERKERARKAREEAWGNKSEAERDKLEEEWASKELAREARYATHRPQTPHPEPQTLDLGPLTGASRPLHQV